MLQPRHLQDAEERQLGVVRELVVHVLERQLLLVERLEGEAVEAGVADAAGIPVRGAGYVQHEHASANPYASQQILTRPSNRLPLGNRQPGECVRGWCFKDACVRMHLLIHS